MAEDRSAVFGGRRYDLRYSHSALRRIQMTTGSLQGLAQEMIPLARSANPAAGLPPNTAALLIWAGQSWTEPKLTLAKMQKRLAAMTDIERQLLTTWACADFLTALMQLLEAQVAKLAAEGDDDE